MNPPEITRIDRRTAITWMLTAAAAASASGSFTLAATAEAALSARGYGCDPDLTRDYRPGELWPLTFDERRLLIAATLCDLILPADRTSPAASALGVPAFIDEWISAPYPGHDRDRRTILEGFAWLDVEARRRFSNDFVNLVPRQRTAICDDICFLPRARPEFESAARFFGRYRDLTATGYYTTPEGMKDAGYTGNRPLDTFAGAPADALRRLGVALSGTRSTANNRE